MNDKQFSLFKEKFKNNINISSENKEFTSILMDYSKSIVAEMCSASMINISMNLKEI